MKPDKKQIPQLVVLGLLVLVCIGYVSFTFLKPPATESAPKAAAGKSSSWKGPSRVAQQIPFTSTFPDLNAPIPRRDPFAVQAIDASGHRTEPEPRKTASTPDRDSAPVTVAPLIPIGGFGPGSAPELSVVERPNMDPDFVLTGVIRGIENVAIIRVGDTGRHVVKQGQTIDGRYRVLHVYEDGVVLGCKDRRIHLKLGGVRNAS